MDANKGNSDGSSASAAVKHFRGIPRESCLASLGILARTGKGARRRAGQVKGMPTMLRSLRLIPIFGLSGH